MKLDEMFLFRDTAHKFTFVVELCNLCAEFIELVAVLNDFGET